MKKFPIIFFAFVLTFGCSDNKEAEKNKPLFPTKREISTKIDNNETETFTPSEIKDETIREKKPANINSIKIKANCFKKKKNGGYWDGDSPPDLFGIVEFPNGEAIAFPLKINSFTNTAYGENITLNKGDKIKISLLDKDISGAEIVANEKFIYNGRRTFRIKSGRATFSFSINKKRIRR